MAWAGWVVCEGHPLWDFPEWIHQRSHEEIQVSASADLLEMEAFDLRWKEACNRKDEEQSAERALMETSNATNEVPEDNESFV